MGKGVAEGDLRDNAMGQSSYEEVADSWGRMSDELDFEDSL